MTSSELAEFVGRVRRLFRGEIDEEIFALAKVRIGGLRLPVCLAALDDYALLYGGSRGKFIPAKFFEFYAKRTTTDENAPATKVEKAVSRHLADEVERERIAEDWDRLRSICQSLAHPRRSEIVNFLHARGWSRFPDRIEDWSQVQILAVSDIATDRIVDGFWNPETMRTDGTEDPRSFWGRVGSLRVGSGDGGSLRPSVDPSRLPGDSGEAGNRVSRVPAGRSASAGDETDIPF